MTPMLPESNKGPCRIFELLSVDKQNTGFFRAQKVTYNDAKLEWFLFNFTRFSVSSHYRISRL